MARIRSFAGIPIRRKRVNNGNINTTPEDVNTRTMREVTDVIRKNAKDDSSRTPKMAERNQQVC